MRAWTATAAAVVALPLVAHGANPAAGNWNSYGGDAAGTHFSSLRQITRANVHKLQEVWRYETPDPGSVETTPLIVDGTMYVVSSRQKVTALDAATGKPKWIFDAGISPGGPTRGLSWWSDGKERRLFSAFANYIYALNPENGEVIKTFGDGGRIDLRANLRGDPQDNAFSATSPAVVYKDMLILGGRVAETLPASPGDERAFDVRTGKLRWSFHTIPHAGEPGADTWPEDAAQTQGGNNAWAGSVVDTDRGIVFFATGSPADDFYGVTRPGKNLYGDCVIALDANTGKLLWYFQAVHHDLWDSDFSAPPVLLTVKRNGKRVAAVAASNKPGYIYIFDRVSGEPLFPIVEQPVPRSTVPGEEAWPTQPIPVAPEPLAKQVIDREELTNRTPEMHAWAQAQFDTFLGTTQHFTPLSIDRTTLITPGWEGGVEWGGMSADPENGILYINANNVISLGTLTDGASYRQSGDGERTYRTQCMGCHGPDRRGTPPAIPSLVDVGTRLSGEQITEVVSNGRGRMPGFSALPPEAIANVISFLRSGKDAVAAAPHRAPPSNSKYVFTGYRYFNDPDGYPAGPMPWGTLNAVDMNTGKYLWRVPFGQFTELAKRGLPDTGAESHGGSIRTTTGLLFVGGSEHDLKFRAYDSADGKILWEGDLPGHGAATPATYAVNGKQYVVIAASPKHSMSGGSQPDPSAASSIVTAATYVAFALH